MPLVVMNWAVEVVSSLITVGQNSIPPSIVVMAEHWAKKSCPVLTNPRTVARTASSCAWV